MGVSPWSDRAELVARRFLHLYEFPSGLVGFAAYLRFDFPPYRNVLAEIFLVGEVRRTHRHREVVRIERLLPLMLMVIPVYRIEQGVEISAGVRVIRPATHLQSTLT